MLTHVCQIRAVGKKLVSRTLYPLLTCESPTHTHAECHATSSGCGAPYDILSHLMFSLKCAKLHRTPSPNTPYLSEAPPHTIQIFPTPRICYKAKQAAFTA